MDENLPRLVRELRKETCPQRVFTEAARRISAQRPSAKRFGYRITIGFAGLALLCCLALWRWPTAPNVPRQVQRIAPADRAETARQAATALEFLGSVLVDAGARSQRAIFNEAVPPLRNSIEATKDKTINRIKL